MESFGLLWNLLDSYGSLMSSWSSLAGLRLEQCSLLWISFLELFGISWILWILLNSFGYFCDFWNLLDSSGFVWNLLEYFGFLCLCRPSLQAFSAGCLCMLSLQTVSVLRLSQQAVSAGSLCKLYLKLNPFNTLDCSSSELLSISLGILGA